MNTTGLVACATALALAVALPQGAAARSDGAFTIIYSADERGEITPCG